MYHWWWPYGQKRFGSLKLLATFSLFYNHLKKQLLSQNFIYFHTIMFKAVNSLWGDAPMKSNHIGFEERGKPEYPEKNLSEQRREPTNSTHIWCWIWKSNLGHIGWRWMLSPLGHPSSSFHYISLEQLYLTQWKETMSTVSHYQSSNMWSSEIRQVCSCQCDAFDKVW